MPARVSTDSRSSMACALVAFGSPDPVASRVSNRAISVAKSSNRRAKWANPASASPACQLPTARSPSEANTYTTPVSSIRPHLCGSVASTVASTANGAGAPGRRAVGVRPPGTTASAPDGRPGRPPGPRTGFGRGLATGVAGTSAAGSTTGRSPVGSGVSVTGVSVTGVSMGELSLAAAAWSGSSVAGAATTSWSVAGAATTSWSVVVFDGACSASSWAASKSAAGAADCAESDPFSMIVDGASSDGALSDCGVVDGALSDGALSDGASSDGASSDGALFGRWGVGRHTGRWRGGGFAAVDAHVLGHRCWPFPLLDWGASHSRHRAMPLEPGG